MKRIHRNHHAYQQHGSLNEVAENSDSSKIQKYAKKYRSKKPGKNEQYQLGSINLMALKAKYKKINL